MHVSYIDIVYIYIHIQLHTPFGFKYHEVIQDSLLRFSKIPSFNKASLTFASHWPILVFFLVELHPFRDRWAHVNPSLGVLLPELGIATTHLNC